MEFSVLLRTSRHIYTSWRLLGRPHHVPDDDTVEKKVTSSVEKARTGMRTKDPRLAQHCTRTWALPSPRGRPRRRICSCPSSAESGVSTQEMAPSGGSPRAEAPSPSSQQRATPRFLACNTASWTRYSLGNSCVCHLHPWVLGRGDHVILPPGLLALHQLLHQEDVHQPGPLLHRLGFSHLQCQEVQLRAASVVLCSLRFAPDRDTAAC